VRESEGCRAALWFSSIRVQEGGRRWHATWRHERERRWLEPRNEAMGMLGRYQAEKAGVGRCAGRPEGQKLIRGRTGLPTKNGPKSRSLQNRTFRILNMIL
jgi:hypothetical protein